jgi:hypothetical protein
MTAQEQQRFLAAVRAFESAMKSLPSGGTLEEQAQTALAMLPDVVVEETRQMDKEVHRVA